jgi:hypothetical protein
VVMVLWRRLFIPAVVYDLDRGSLRRPSGCVSKIFPPLLNDNFPHSPDSLQQSKGDLRVTLGQIQCLVSQDC